MDGGPIGLRATGPVSRIIMDHWREEIKTLEENNRVVSRINPVGVEELTIHWLTKYVDDVAMALDEMRRGVRWCPGKKVMLWSQEWEEDDRKNGTNPEEATVKEVAKMASTVINNIRFTYDAPCMSDSMTLAVLDTQIWMGEEQREEGIPEELLENKERPRMKTNNLKKVVLFRFYQKPMTNRVANLRSSAQPEGMKVATVAAEVIRRCKNTSRDLPKNILEDTLIIGKAEKC